MDYEPDTSSRPDQDDVSGYEPDPGQAPVPGGEEHTDLGPDPVAADYRPEYESRVAETAAGGASSAFRWLFETILTIAAAVALALFLQAYVVKTYVVPTGSMVPTIQLEDRIISNRLAYRFGEPEAGDVVVFENPSHEGPPLVKRLIATEGQQVNVVEGVVYIDGEPLDEPYVEAARRGDDSLVEPVVVPEGEVWLMGDNRRGSSDSRVFGTRPVSEIHGQAIFTYWPPESFGPLR